MFGRDHAGVGDFYGPYDAQNLLTKYRDKLSLKPVFLRENWCWATLWMSTAESWCVT